MELFVEVRYYGVSAFFQDYNQTNNFSLSYIMDIFNNSPTNVFPPYVTIDIFNAAIYCNNVPCDMEQLMEVHLCNTSAPTTTDITTDAASTMNFDFLFKWYLMLQFTIYVAVLYGE